MTKPFIKWVGGKRWLAPELKRHFPRKPKRYIEPFVGGGGLYFNVWKRFESKDVVLSDSNATLIDTYLSVKEDPKYLIESLRKLAVGYRENDPKEFYLQIRDSYNSDPTPDKLIFLNKTGFNGLYRINSKGKFNVPWGQRPQAKICDPENIMECSEALQGVMIKNIDAFDIIKVCSRGDFVYLDPPYYGTFRGYTSMAKDYEHIFHQELGRISTNAVIDRGVNILISNSNCQEVENIYTSSIWRKFKLEARRSVSRDSSGRKPETELLMRSYGER